MVAKIRVSLLALVLSPVSLASLALADEPNDQIDQATSSGLDGIGTVIIQGVEITNLPSSTDVDLYSFTISSGTLLPVLVTASLDTAQSTLDGYLRLFTSDGVELANNDDDDYPHVDAVLTTFLLTEGIYYVGVSSTGVSAYDAIVGSIRTSGTEGPYSLTITTAGAELPESPFEPNDVQPTWTGLGVGTFEALGEFIGDGENDREDVDLYTFEVGIPILVTIDVTAAHLGATLDPVVELISLVSNKTIGRNSYARLDTVDARIEVALFDTNLDEYKVKITGGHRPQSVGPYDLRITTTPLEMSGPGTFEPNDSVLVATPTGLSGTGTVILSAHIGDGSFAETVGDVDFYEFQATVGDVITIEAAPDGPKSELDPIIGLYAFYGQRRGFDDNGGGGSSSRLSELICSAIEPDACLCPSDADEVTAYAMVMGTRQRFPIDALARHLDFDPSWPIQNQFDGGPGSTGNYTITMTTTAEAAGCAAEPNDSIANAVSTDLPEGVRYVCRSGALGD
ncbi:MAG: PPC domain-containing protein [Planctomycetes bacterium]|nr:PPC domain-containing protein [Planctomycetota bacterium]